MRIFPVEILEFTTEHYVSSIRTRSQIIYSVVVLSVIAAAAALPFVKVSVSSQSRGALRSETSQTAVVSSASGHIREKAAKENDTIEKGAVLFRLISDKLERQKELISSLLAEKIGQVNDLRRLQSLDRTALLHAKAEFAKTLDTGLYASDFEQLYVRLADYRRREEFLGGRFERLRYLHEKGLASEDSFEETKANFAQVGDELSVFIESNRRRWSQLAADESAELNRLKAEQDRLSIEEDSYTIRSPVSGAIQEIERLSVGSFVSAGQTLGIVSPDDSLVVEALVDPRDIGFIEVDSQLLIQVDAFNFREWGSLNGKVIEISEDIHVSGNQPFFRVKCSIDDRPYLELANGARGKLRKGMTVTCRFLLAKRSLFQLLYDQADDWFSPYRIEGDQS